MYIVFLTDYIYNNIIQKDTNYLNSGIVRIALALILIMKIRLRNILLYTTPYFLILQTIIKRGNISYE